MEDEPNEPREDESPFEIRPVFSEMETEKEKEAEAEEEVELPKTPQEEQLGYNSMVWAEALFKRFIDAISGRGGVEAITGYADQIDFIELLTPLRQRMKNNDMFFQTALSKCNKDLLKRPLLIREDESYDILGFACENCVDAFAEPHNALCKRFYTREQDGCLCPWADVTFANPEFDAMADVLRQASWQAERRGVRSVVIGPAGGAQSWLHEFAIMGTIYLPNRRINFDLPDGTPTIGADRDTIIMTFGGEHINKRWKRGDFRVKRLPLDKPSPQPTATEQLCLKHEA